MYINDASLLPTLTSTSQDHRYHSRIADFQSLKLTSMNSQLIVLIVMSCTLGLVTSAAMPLMRITRLEKPDACLFVCNICFHDDDEQMMSCANDYCLGPNIYSGLPYLSIGKSCKHWDALEKHIISQL